VLPEPGGGKPDPYWEGYLKSIAGKPCRYGVDGIGNAE